MSPALGVDRFQRRLGFYSQALDLGLLWRIFGIYGIIRRLVMTAYTRFAFTVVIGICNSLMFLYLGAPLASRN